MPVLVLVASILAVFDAAAGAERRRTEVQGGATTLMTVEPGRTAWLRARPGGTVVTRVGARTPFGSPSVLAALRRRGDWALVSHPALGNRRAWVHVGGELRQTRTTFAIRVDLKARRATVTRAGRVARRFVVSIGAPGSPTPTGTFQVTDRLAGERYSPVYGCCILALSGRQPNPPSGWQGGDRLALHGTPKPEPTGRAVTAGCLRARTAPLRWLMRHAPPGTPVHITRAAEARRAF